MEVLGVIRSRRSVRRYKSTPLDAKTLELVLEAARWAPSWANTQCWRFIVVEDGELKKELANTLNPTNPAIDALKGAPLVIVACAELGKSGYYHGEPMTDKGDWCMFDVALSMQNLVLAAHSLGLGTVYVGRFDAKKVASLIGLPAGFGVIAMTPLGYPDEESKTVTRKEPSEIIFYDKYGRGKGR